MSMIASAVGGSKATLYSYFPTKADLFVALMERAWVRQGSEEPPPITCDDARGWIAHAVEDYLRHLYSEEVLALHRLLIAEAARFPELGRRMYEAGPAQGLARLSGSLTQLARHGLICCETPVAAARQLRALAKSEHYDALLWCALDPPGREEIARHSDHVAATFLALHGAPSASQPTFRASTGRRTGDPSSNEGE